MTTLQEALPCPFCGKQHTLQVISGQELMGEDQEFWQHSDSFGVVCDASSPDGKGGCGAMGGFKPTEDEAIEAWNTRSALAQQELPQKERPDFMAGYDAGMVDAKRMAQQVEPTDDQLVKGVKAMRLFVTKNSVADFKLGYMAALAAAPAPQPVHQGERAELIRRLLAIANTEANEVADALNEAADMLQSAQPSPGQIVVDMEVSEQFKDYQHE